MTAICDESDQTELYEEIKRYNEEPSFAEQLDYIPFISSVTGAVRVVFGILEVVFGLLLLPFELIGAMFSTKKKRFVLIQGGIDILRGYVAAHPFVGNIALYLFDHLNLFKRY